MDSSRPKLSLFFAALVFLGGCAGRNEPRLEASVNSVYQPVAFSAYQVTGQRDGAVTTAVAAFTLQNGKHLQVNLKIVYDPVPQLASGEWHLDGEEPGAGEVKSESLKFLGGQGEGPSLGGRFRLDEDGSPRFRVTLPLRPLRRPG